MVLVPAGMVPGMVVPGTIILLLCKVHSTVQYSTCNKPLPNPCIQ